MYMFMITKHCKECGRSEGHENMTTLRKIQLKTVQVDLYYTHQVIKSILQSEHGHKLSILTTSNVVLDVKGSSKMIKQDLNIPVMVSRTDPVYFYDQLYKAFHQHQNYLKSIYIIYFQLCSSLSSSYLPFGKKAKSS